VAILLSARRHSYAEYRRANGVLRRDPGRDDKLQERASDD